MKGQQLFYSFLPGVTAAVLTTQPAWAGTVKLTGVKVASSPSVLTSTYGQNSVVDMMNTQLPNSANVSVPTLVPSFGFTKLSMKPLSNNSIPAFTAGNTVVPIKQVLKKDRGRFLSLTPTSNPSQQVDVSRSAQNNQKQSNSSADGQKSESIVVPNYTSKLSPVQKEILPLSSAQQPVVQKINTVTELQTFLQTSTTGGESAKLLSGQRCQQESGKSKTDFLAALRLASSTCLQQNAVGRIAQSNTPIPTDSTPTTVPGSVTPAPGNSVLPATVPGSVTPAPGNSVLPATVPGSVTPAPGGSVQVPNNLIPNSNPLQFPTKAEEVTFQGNQPITLAQALELARRNNHDLQVSILQLERSRAAVREAQAALLPTLGVSADITRSQSASSQLQDELSRQQGFPSNTGSPSTGFNGQAQLTYNLYTSGNREATIRQAEEQERSDELAVETQYETIRLNVATDYYNLQQADEQVRISQSAVTNSAASLRDAESLERAGVGTRFDVLRSQVTLANSQQNLTNAISQQQIARRQLATRISLPQSVNISAADPVQLAGLWNQTLEQTIVLAFQNRSELQQQLAQRNISEQQRRQALSALGPQVSLVASYSLLDQFNDSVSVTDGYSVGVRASLSLYDGGAARARASQAKANIAIAETQFAEQRNQIRFQVEQAYSNQQSSLENVQTANTALEQAREALRLARLRFQAGVGTQTDVINSENDLTQAEGNRVTAILGYNRALAQLQRSVTLRGLR
ncbi:transporter [Nostoc sp. 'Peltigera membranacea cyanobiont' 213]|uniref:TolC family protein n=1 Tax=unclassified Nostoc TaxID=2593658 RepID=UPI000B95A4FC|nr:MULTISPECIES: TolC family protein [unclassified Nostoc]AVH65446.1 outer membrane efflux protein TolC [Nostoc sp. 'Peltigera membranacea cyanobiont' N6]OYD98382.1 transporter [Nostoc sp. 'Peltigera membranacea cyanobiont' 213]